MDKKIYLAGFIFIFLIGFISAELIVGDTNNNKIVELVTEIPLNVTTVDLTFNLSDNWVTDQGIMDNVPDLYPTLDLRYLELDGSNFGFSPGIYLSYSEPNFAFNEDKLNKTIDDKLKTLFFNASTVDVITGTPQGSIVDIRSYNLVSYNVSEDASDLELRVNFTNIEDFNQLIVRYKSDEADEPHDLNVQIYEPDNDLWEGYGTLTSTGSYQIVVFGIFDSDEHIGDDDVVQVRFFQDEGSPPRTHKHLFDWVAIAKGFGTPTGEEIDPKFDAWLGNPIFTMNVNGSLINSSWDSINVSRVFVDHIAEKTIRHDVVFDNNVDLGSKTFTTTGFIATDRLVSSDVFPLGSGTVVNVGGGGAIIDFNENFVPGLVPEGAYSSPYNFYVTFTSGSLNGQSCIIIHATNENENFNDLDSFNVEDCVGVSSGDTFGLYLRNRIIAGDMTVLSLESSGDIYTTGSGDDLWLGHSTQASAGFQAYATGEVRIDADNIKLLFGEGQDASIYYDGVDMIINPKETGSGQLRVLGDLNVTGTSYLKDFVLDGNVDLGDGNLTTTGNVYIGNIIISDSGYIGSASDVDAIQIEADGDVVLTRNLFVGSLAPDKTIHLGNARLWEHAGTDFYIRNRNHGSEIYIGAENEEGSLRELYFDPDTLSFSPYSYDGTFNLGQPHLRWKNIYAAGNVTAGYFNGSGAYLHSVNISDDYAKYQFTTNDFNGSGSFTTIGNAYIGNITSHNLTLTGGLTLAGNINAAFVSTAAGIGALGDIDTFISLGLIEDTYFFQAGGLNFMKFTETFFDAIIINEDANNMDFRVEGVGDTYLLFTDAGTDKVCIGCNNPDEKLEVVGNIHLDDNNKLISGTGKDASIYYNGTAFIIDSAETGTASTFFKESVVMEKNITMYDADGVAWNCGVNRIGVFKCG